MGSKVSLREEGRETDIEDLFRWTNLEEWQYYDEPDSKFEPISREEFDSSRPQKQQSSGNSRRWAVDTVEGKHIGWVNYYDYDLKKGLAYIGICLPEEETWGKGYSTEALSQLLRTMFRGMKLYEIRLATWLGNVRMIRCANRCGFREINRGPHRTAISVRGEPLERIEFSISRTDWEKES